jgi:hypothetical protein
LNDLANRRNGCFRHLPDAAVKVFIRDSTLSDLIFSRSRYASKEMAYLFSPAVRAIAQQIIN